MFRANLNLKSALGQVPNAIFDKSIGASRIQSFSMESAVPANSEWPKANNEVADGDKL